MDEVLHQIAGMGWPIGILAVIAAGLIGGAWGIWEDRDASR
jgi:hypothetical protein